MPAATRSTCARPGSTSPPSDRAASNVSRCSPFASPVTSNRPSASAAEALARAPQPADGVEPHHAAGGLAHADLRAGRGRAVGPQDLSGDREAPTGDELDSVGHLVTRDLDRGGRALEALRVGQEPEAARREADQLEGAVVARACLAPGAGAELVPRSGVDRADLRARDAATVLVDDAAGDRASGLQRERVVQVRAGGRRDVLDRAGDELLRLRLEPPAPADGDAAELEGARVGRRPAVRSRGCRR